MRNSHTKTTIADIGSLIRISRSHERNAEMGLRLDNITMRNTHSEMRIADMGSLSRQNRYENFSFRNEKCEEGDSV